MPVHRGNIGEVVQKAWNDARCAAIAGSGQREANRKRSRIWIGSLAKRFGEHYAGVRLTPLGTVASERARHVLREIEAAEERIEAAVSGRTGSFRIAASPMWMQAILPAAIARFHQTCPGVELKLSTASFAEGLRRLTDGDSDLHCGGVDAGASLPRFLRREHVLDIAAGIVAGEGHPLLAARPAIADLAGYPWIDYGAPAPTPGPALTGPSSLPAVLDALYAYTGKQVQTVVRADTVELFLLAAGPWLAWLR